MEKIFAKNIEHGRGWPAMACNMNGGCVTRVSGLTCKVLMLAVVGNWYVLFAVTNICKKRKDTFVLCYCCPETQAS